ncbi:glycosyl hydrolase family 61-domain-containing protein [Dendryphion nanum]|uniref:AA9 family lytic polysaccharide monooxygenase n=1 Tax=Dendryphion nanum TaxID=256645 RepID=A0A9P9DBA8_9PLEO|nr:glycosyl hydrolase family 61-domain-containing protein [Dendryphion nanum]
MLSKSMLLALAAAPSVLAHTSFVQLSENGKPFGDAYAIRMNPDAANAGSPIASLDSTDMACNVKGTTGVPFVAKVTDGSTLTFAIRSWADDPSKPSLDRGHKGPCAIYMKKVASAKNDKGAGDGWFKVAAEGYEGTSSSGKWCTDKIIDNGGFLSFSIPKGLQGGDYLVRPEILALHAVAASNDPQFYTGCAQVFLESQGNLVPESTVSIPGHVKKNEPSTSFNIYYGMDPTTYQLPGPGLAKLVSGTATSQTQQTDGFKPEGCILLNGNWCAKEIPDFTTETGCWASTEDCWNQNKACFANAPPTGGKGCKLWEAKCEAQSNACKSKNFNGVLNKGKRIDSDQANVEYGFVFPTQIAGGSGSPSPPKSSATPQGSAAPSNNPQPSSQKYEAVKTSADAPKPTVEDYNPPATTLTRTRVRPNGGRPTGTITIPVSEGAAPTNFVCPKGLKCVTTTIVKTEVQYKTVLPNSYKRSVLHRKRHGHVL